MMDIAIPSEAATMVCPENIDPGTTAKKQYTIMMKWAAWVSKAFHVWDTRPRCGYVFTGSYWGGLDCSNTAMTFATLARFGDYDENITGIGREQLAEMSVQLIRYLCFTHDTGPEDCVRADGRGGPEVKGTKWGEKGWGFFIESAVGDTIFPLGFAAWLLWDRLDTETRMLVETVLAEYADHFTAIPPRDGSYFDTQTEENAWTAKGISIAAFLFPQNPRADAWREACMAWAANSTTISVDRFREKKYSGNVAPYIATVTTHPDFTAENHGFVHPDYICAGIQRRSSVALAQMAAGITVSDCVTYRWKDVFDRTLKVWMTDDVSFINVQGQDWWWKKSVDALSACTCMNVLLDDGDAAALEARCTEFLEKVQQPAGMFLEENGAEILVTRSAAGNETVEDFEFMLAQIYATSYLLHVFSGAGAKASDLDDISNRLEGVRSYPFGGVITGRTGKFFSSVSWRNNIMALTLPKKGLWSFTPYYLNYTGIILADPVSDADLYNKKERVSDHIKLNEYPDGYGACFDLPRLGGKLTQKVAFLHLPFGTVYIEDFTCAEEVAAGAFQTGMLGIRNENLALMGEYAKGFRDLYFDDGSVRRFDGYYGGENIMERFPPVRFMAVDREMGFIALHSNGIKYCNFHSYKRWRGLEDNIVFNDYPDGRTFRPGEMQSPFVLVSLPDYGIEETKLIYSTIQSPKIISGDGVTILQIDRYLIFVDHSLSGKDKSIEASFSISGRVPLFAGITEADKGKLIWNGTVAAGTANWLEAEWLAEGLANSSGIRIDIAPGGKGVITNNGSETVSILLYRHDNPKVCEFHVAPGRFANVDNLI